MLKKEYLGMKAISNLQILFSYIRAFLMKGYCFQDQARGTQHFQTVSVLRMQDSGDVSLQPSPPPLVLPSSCSKGGGDKLYYYVIFSLILEDHISPTPNLIFVHVPVD